MSSFFFKSIINVCLALILTTSTLFATLPPSVFKRLQDAAPEALSIRVLTVEAWWTGYGKSKYIEACAKVLAVERSATGVKVGDQMLIKYNILYHGSRDYMLRTEALLHSTAEYDAFLTQGKDGVFVPAAEGSSFKRTRVRDAALPKDPPPILTMKLAMDLYGYYLCALAALIFAILFVVRKKKQAKILEAAVAAAASR